jgi:hypothetical protein
LPLPRGWVYSKSYSTKNLQFLIHFDQFWPCHLVWHKLKSRQIFICTHPRIEGPLSQPNGTMDAAEVSGHPRYINGNRQISNVSQLVVSGSSTSMYQWVDMLYSDWRYVLTSERAWAFHQSALTHLPFSQLLRLQTPSPEPVLPMPALPQVPSIQSKLFAGVIYNNII